MTKSKKIQELSELWGFCLVDHHKDKDTKHYLNIRYCFGDILYSVEHFGYVFSEYQKDFFTLSAAQDYLITKLEEQTRKECNNQISRHLNPGSWDVEDLNKDIHYWENIIEKLGKIIDIPTDDLEQKLDEEDYWSIKKDLEKMNYHYKLVEEILDKEQIPIKDTKYDMEYSINYRVELLVNKLKNKK